MTQYFKTTIQAAQVGGGGGNPGPPACSAIYLGSPIQLISDPPPPPNNGGNLIIPYGAGDVIIPLGEQNAQSLGSLLGTVGYGQAGNSLSIYTNGYVGWGPTLAGSLNGMADNEQFANAYIACMKALAAAAGGTNDESLDWLYALDVGLAAAAAVAVGVPGVIVGLATVGVASLIWGSSPAYGDQPASSYQAMDTNGNWLSGDTINATFGGSPASFVNNWKSFF